MLSITLSNNFEKKYKTLPEVIRAQVKKTIKKMAANCTCESLNTKKNGKLYESSINSKYKVIWECTDKKNACLLDIESSEKTSNTLDKLYEIDDEIKEREKKMSSEGVSVKKGSSVKYK